MTESCQRFTQQPCLIFLFESSPRYAENVTGVVPFSPILVCLKIIRKFFPPKIFVKNAKIGVMIILIGTNSEAEWDL